MHIQITDFGTAKQLSSDSKQGTTPARVCAVKHVIIITFVVLISLLCCFAARANSFVGTAQYVSPELLTEKSACKRYLLVVTRKLFFFLFLSSECIRNVLCFFSSDLWALGCIIYQLVAGLPPFRAG